MIHPPLRPRGVKRVLSALAVAVLVPAANAQDPFKPSLRWIHQAPAAEPWVPGSAQFVGGANLVWSSAKGAERWMALDADGPLVNAPRFEDVAPAGAINLRTAAGDRADRLFSVAQYPSPGNFDRRTETTRHDAIAAAQTGSFAPVWTHDAGFTTNGPARIAADGSGDTVVIAVWNDATSEVQIDWLDGATGALASRVTVPAMALSEIDVSADGSAVAVAAALDLYVFDGSATLVHQKSLPAATHALSLSGDGLTLAVGSIGKAFLLEQQPVGTWTDSFEIPAPSNRIATRADLSADGGTLAIGWWNYVNAVDARFELWDARQQTLLQSLTQVGTPNGPQNMPQVVRVTADGQRAVFGAWGNGSGDPEVVLLDRDLRRPVATADVPGSVQALDLDPTGSRIVVAYKDVHNNQFGTTGGIRLYDTGERRLQALGPAEIGSNLHLAAKREGASAAFFLVGDRGAVTSIPGVQGSLLLDRATLAIHGRPVNAVGRADLQLAIPNDVSLIGTQFAVQTAFRTPAGTVIQEDLVDPLVLD